MEDQQNRVLDLDNLEKEKIRLIHLLRPAIEQFVISTGVIPSLHISKFNSSIETKCGTMWSEGEVNISISVSI